MRRLSLTLLTLALPAGAGAGLTTALAAPAHPAGAAAKHARLQGAFAMRGRITAGGSVPGQRPGKRIRRSWKFSPACATGQCPREQLKRRRGPVMQLVTLGRLGPGHYSVRSSFYGPLRCGGRIYRLGEQVAFVISVRVRKAVRIQSRPFATGITASYRAVSAINRTPCVAFLGRDAAVYTGTLTSPLPTPPHAGFRSSSLATAVTFHDASASGRGGAPIVSWQWNFGDPSSGANNQSGQRNPSHTFAAPGTYTVTLTVRDSLGLTGSVQQPVTVP